MHTHKDRIKVLSLEELVDDPGPYLGHRALVVGVVGRTRPFLTLADNRLPKPTRTLRVICTPRATHLHLHGVVPGAPVRFAGVVGAIGGRLVLRDAVLSWVGDGRWKWESAS